MSQDAKPKPTKPEPAKIHVDAIEWTPAEGAVTRVRIKRLITRAHHGSELTQGVCVMDPGEATNLWSSATESDVGAGGHGGDQGGDHWYGPVEETYFCIRGRLKLIWDQGEIEFGPLDSVYLAPGWHYRLENVGEDEAFFVYNMTPSQE